MIVGAGPAVLEAACDLGHRGFRPMIYEKTDRPGGLINYAALPPRKARLREIILCRTKELERLQIPIQFSTDVDVPFILHEKPDVLILATGSSASHPPIPGAESPSVFTADEIMSGARQLKGRHIAIIGGGLVGCETADALAAQGYDVDLIEADESIGNALTSSRRHFLFDSLSAHSVRVHVKTQLEGIALPVLKLKTAGYSYNLPDVDSVVLAIGRKPADALSAGIRDALPECRIQVIGDAKEIGTALDAIYSAAGAVVRV